MKRSKGKTKHSEAGETAEMEGKAHSPAFLKRAAKAAGKKRGRKK